NETEKLNTMFASGLVPDLVSAPYWSTTGGEGKVIKEAAAQGMLYDVTDLLDKYPNVKKLYEVGIAKDYLQFDVDHPDFNGRRYVIPQQTPSDSPLDITNWTYGAYARGDIIKALGVDPTTITSAEALYDLAVKIRDGGFLDTTGKPVIPMGTWHNGWSYGEFTDSFGKGYFISDYRQREDGTIYSWQFDDVEEQKLLYMRKLISDGLLDVECFSNTDTMAKEKMAIGKIAIFGAQSMVGSLQPTLYATNPEMEFVLLGPMINQKGDIVTQVEKKGRSGSPVLFLGAGTTKAEDTLRVLDYLNSDEGKLLAKWGIEGEHYTMNADGIPIYDPELKAKMDADPKVRWNLGLDTFANQFIGADDRTSKYPTPEDQKSYYDKLLDSFKAQLPIVQIDKVSVNYLTRDYEKLAEYQDAVSTLDYEAELRRAYFAASDDEALKILADARQRMLDAGAEGLWAHIQARVASYPNPDELGF
ncbi:MAG: ABC transporter substrate-binding protein, partial [Clostridiales bacterium]|nr:ABC transporter substrate-binding protein [Clostridiales bacterium]